MKKFFKNAVSVLLGAIVLSVALLGVGCFTVPEIEKEPSLEYKLIDNTYYEVTGIGTITETDVIIPETYNQLPVKAIADSAFQSNASLTSVSVPKSVTALGKYAFNGCDKLTSVKLGASVKTIGESAFQGCANLQSVVIPDSVTGIEGYAFAGCTKLESVTLGNSVKTIKTQAFASCISLKNIKIPHSVTSVGSLVFWGCTGLENVELGNSVKSIGESSFNGCTNLLSVTFGNAIKTIARCSFSGCENLTGLEIPVSVTFIGDSTFAGCTSLTTVIFKNTQGWKATFPKTENVQSLSSEDLTNYEKAALYLKSTDYYCLYGWSRA